MANIDEGTVLGGRYEITGRVMASAQQDQVLTGLDQVLNREVLILVASRDNASQAAQSARQLATGERNSSIQILDLGLSDNRTYLVAPGNSDVEDFLALLTSEDVYVEPFFTEHLGTEIFGEARQRTPETFDDDAEYYRELQDDLAEEHDATKRPEFINKISDRIDDWLQEDDTDPAVTPGQTPVAPAAPAAPTTPHEQPTQAIPPITEEQEQAPIPVPPPPATKRPTQQQQAPKKQPTPLIPPPIPDEPGPEDGYAIEYTDEKQRSTAGRWLGGLLLVAILVFAVAMGFRILGNPDEEPPVATDPTTETPTQEDPTQEPEPEETQEPTGQTPVPVNVQRVVPDSPNLNSDYDADLPTIIDGNLATAWHTYTYTTPQFGGFASNMAVVVELEEESPITEITIAQNQGSGGAFTVAVSNEPTPGTGETITEGSFTGPEYTVDARDADGEPITGNYIIIDFTELPTLSNTNSPDRPYGLRIAEIDVN